MNVSELYKLTRWISREIEGTQIPNKYQILQNILQQHAQPNNQKQPFESETNDLKQSLLNVPLNILTRDQLAFLDEIGILSYVGKDGATLLEDVLFRNVIDVATSAQKIAIIQQSISDGINKSNQIKTGLDGCVLEEEYEAEDEILIRVSFTGDALIKDVTDFKKWGVIWHDIGRGIALANDATPEDVKIVGATQGSIIIELATTAAIATTASTIILSALKVAEKVIDIRIKAEQLKALQLQNKKLANEVEKEAENEKSNGIDAITKQIAKELKLKKDEGDKVTALDTAVKNLVEFIEEGGIVDFIPTDEDEEDEAKQKLNLAFEEIRQLENKIALLEYRGEEENAEDDKEEG